MSDTIIRPQPGAQEKFMRSSADIVIYGGAAGSGKSYCLLLEPIRYIDNPRYGGVIFRQNSNQITNEGGLWDTSMEIYPLVQGAYPRITPNRKWIFPSGAEISFGYIERDPDVLKFQGSQICFLGFDELTHFSKFQFFYMLSRNRSTCGVKPYVRATCNPDADSWVAEFIEWWIDQDTGYAIKERSGKIRWMVRVNDTIYWSDTRKEAVQQAIGLGMDPDKAGIMPKSVTFISATLYDNKALLDKNPQYEANLLALGEVERERLLMGNWKIKPQAGLYFKRGQVRIIPTVPPDLVSYCRGWDLAATTEDEDGDAAYTAGVLMAKRADDTLVVLDVINQRLSAGEVRTTIMNTAMADRMAYGWVRTRVPQDPGQAGKAQAQDMIKMLQGYDAVARPESGSKENRAAPVAAQWQHGNIEIIAGPWNDMYFSQLESFPESKFKDMVDATSSAFNELTQEMGFNIDNML